MYEERTQVAETVAEVGFGGHRGAGGFLAFGCFQLARLILWLFAGHFDSLVERN